MTFLKLILFIALIIILAEPGAPGNVEVADVDSNSVTLEWSKPRSDGGSKINGYVIEFRPVNGGSWEKAPTGPIRGNSGTGRYN